MNHVNGLYFFSDMNEIIFFESEYALDNSIP